jgi:hypothetical protein
VRRVLRISFPALLTTKRKQQSNPLKLTTHPIQSHLSTQRGHLDEFCFRRKRIKRRHAEYARNSYHDEFINFSLRFYSHVLSRFYSHASSHTSSCAFPQFSYGPNHPSYDFGSRENRFEHKHFGYDPRPHHGDHFPRRPDFPAGGLYTHFELRHLDSSRFSRRGSCPTRPSGEVQKIVKTSSGRMVKC